MLTGLLNRYHQMFENQQKKSGRTSNGSKHNSTSRPKISKKEAFKPLQKIVLEVLKTDGYHNNSGEIKSKKSKSQCMSNDLNPGRKSIDVSKFIKTTRSNGQKKSRDRHQKFGKFQEQISTQMRHNKHENIFLSNLPTQKSSQLKWAKKNSLKKNTEGRSAQRKKSVWNEKQLPIDNEYAAHFYSHYLTRYEQHEIKEYKKVYYIGHKAAKSECIDLSQSKFDNEDKEYRYVENDHVAYRYQILTQIGKGSYGQVLKAFDHKTKEQVALKMIKSDPKFSKQAFIQIKILSYIKERDDDHQSNVVKIKDFVIFRKHVCIIFELLSDNLYELIIRNNYNGLSEELIRRFAIQILVSLEYLRSHKIVHCDLKPENILLKQFNKSGIKLIDFGSSCFEKQTLYTYIQSRYYRAPEITLGIPYDHNIDIWSTGCILAELYTGVPVFPGENQMEQMKYMTDTLGMPPKDIVDSGCRKTVFFTEEGTIKPEVQSLTTTMDMFSKPLRERVDNKDFLSFIEGFLRWDSKSRVSALDALSHPWVSKGLPEQLKNKLSVGGRQFVKSRPKREGSASKYKSKGKEKGSSSSKLTSKSSHEKIKRNYGYK